MKLHVVYGTNEHCKPVADVDALEFAKKQINRIKGTDQELQVNTSTYAVILAFRVLVKRGDVSHNDILFYNAIYPQYSNTIIDKSTFDSPIKIDKNGSLQNELTNYHTDFYLELIDFK